MMKRLKVLFIKVKSFVVEAFKRLFRGFMIVLPWIPIVFAWALFVFSFIAMFLIPYWVVIYPLLVLIVMLVIYVGKIKYLKRVRANTIIYGGRGSGKGLLFQKIVNSEKKVFSNIPYGPNCEVISPKEYFGSITPNTALRFLNDEVEIIDKIEKYEGVPYLSDDTTIFFPNYLDNTLKKNYPAISLFLPIQRHLLNSYSVFNAQDINRIYIHVRELQLDGYIKALSSRGFGWFWRRLPILRNYVRVKYRFYENVDSAVAGLLPFNKLGLVSKPVSSLYLTAGEATREQYEASNGVISDGAIWLNKKELYYDTRYYHSVFYGFEAPLDKNITKRELRRLKKIKKESSS